LVQDGGEASVEYIPGAVVSKQVSDGRLTKGLTGFARYSDEAYKAREDVGGRNSRYRDRIPYVPDEAPPREGWNKLRWYRGISALYPSDG
jgi:hypothetical protein